MLNIPKSHEYNPYCVSAAGSEREWFGNDSHDKYLKNLNEKRELLEKNNWIDSKFTYKFNSNGFRCEEFTNDPSVLFLGCSNTFGDGLPRENRFTDIVADQLKLKCVNLGQSGGSCDSSFRIAHHWIPKINPNIVIFLEPPGIRLELILENDMVQLSPIWATSSTPFGRKSSKYIDYLQDWSATDYNHNLNSLKNKLAIETICQSRNIKFMHYKFTAIYSVEVDKARDLSHMGRKTHQLFAEKVLVDL